MKEVLVVGIGSRIMMDDGIGVYLVEDLKRHIRNPNVEFIVGETDIDYCCSEISNGNHYIIVIDAFLSGKAPGEVTVIPLCDLKKEQSRLLIARSALFGYNSTNETRDQRNPGRN